MQHICVSVCLSLSTIIFIWQNTHLKVYWKKTACIDLGVGGAHQIVSLCVHTQISRQESTRWSSLLRSNANLKQQQRIKKITPKIVRSDPFCRKLSHRDCFRCASLYTVLSTLFAKCMNILFSLREVSIFCEHDCSLTIRSDYTHANFFWCCILPLLRKIQH